MLNSRFNKIKKIIRIIICIFVVWLFIPYAEVGYLTMKYGKYFEKEYAQSSWFDEEPYMSVKVFRYKDEKARVISDSKFIKEYMEDKRENIAVVCYGALYVMLFQYDGKEWKLDKLDSGGERFMVLQSATTSNATWPYYLW